MYSCGFEFAPTPGLLLRSTSLSPRGEEIVNVPASLLSPTGKKVARTAG